MCAGYRRVLPSVLLPLQPLQLKRIRCPLRSSPAACSSVTLLPMQPGYCVGTCVTIVAELVPLSRTRPCVEAYAVVLSGVTNSIDFGAIASGSSA